MLEILKWASQHLFSYRLGKSGVLKLTNPMLIPESPNVSSQKIRYTFSHVNSVLCRNRIRDERHRGECEMANQSDRQ